jgi:hypothetical protein
MFWGCITFDGVDTLTHFQLCLSQAIEMAKSDNLIHFSLPLDSSARGMTWSIIILKDVPTVWKYFSDYWPYIITKSF